MGMKLLSHPMKLSLVSPHKYHATSTKLNAFRCEGFAAAKGIQVMNYQISVCRGITTTTNLIVVMVKKCMYSYKKI